MTTARPLIAALTTAALTGCSALDRAAVSDFRPVGSTKFEYRAQAGALDYPSDSPWAEQVRMDWLRTWLDDNGMCSSGYEITDRQEVKVGLGARIWYRGRCT